MKSIARLIAFLFLAATLSLSALAADDSQPKIEVPKIDAGLGACYANFKVTDGNGKPIYDAKIHTLIRTGLFGIKKTDLQIGTNSNGLAKITGLPDYTKRAVNFEISKDGKTKSVPFEPGMNCHPVVDVELK